MVAQILPFAGLAAVILATALLTTLALRYLRQSSRRPAPEAEEDRLTLLFDGDRLLDATATGRAFLTSLPQNRRGDRARFIAWAEQSFPAEAAALSELKSTGVVEIGPGSDCGLMLRAEWRSGLQHITLFQARDSAAGAEGHLASRMRDRELERLRALIEALPFPVWTEDPRSGMVTSWNTACESLLPERGRSRTADPPPERGPWPLPPIFPPGAADGSLHSAGPPGKERVWRILLADMPGPALRLAVPADAAQGTADTTGPFSTLLARAFAGLPIGLAMFSPPGELSLFNPALAELTRLPAAFLEEKPTLPQFLDALRSRNMLPEPRDYAAWRAEIAAIGSPDSPTYDALWSLPDGQTFHVLGLSPDPGSVTLLLRDISPEVTRIRRLQTDLALGQAAMDALEEAVIVFSSSSDILFSNKAFESLWQQDLSERVTLQRLDTLSAHWRADCVADPFWDEVEAWLRQPGPGAPLDGVIRRLDGRSFWLRLRPLTDDAVMVIFQSTTPGASSRAPPDRAPQVLPSRAG